MKNLKYLSMAMLMFIGIGSMQAQEKTLAKKDAPVKQHALQKTDRAEKMQKELNLTPDQIKQIEAIRAKRADEKTRLKNEMKRLNEEERNEIQAVYTPEQKEKIKTMKENRQEKMKANQGKRKMKHKKMQHRKHQ